MQNNEKSFLDERLDALVQQEIKYINKYGENYFKSGTGLFGRATRKIFKDSGEGLRVFTDMRQANNQLGGNYTNEELASMINKGYRNAGYDYTFKLPEKFQSDRVKKAEGNLVGDQKKLDVDGDGTIEASDLKKLRQRKQEGGNVDMQMAALMKPQQEQVMASDEDMEEDYLDFILDEALTEEEEEMLQDRLEQDEQLALLFDKVIDVAQEFAGAGLVEGPGNGISDSIPARLSDGEFVFTAKATEEIGADELMRMMKDAEAKADERQGFVYGGEAMGGEAIEDETFIVEPTEPEPVKQEIRVQRETVGPQATEQEEEELVEEIRTRKMMTGKASPVS